MEGAGGAWCEGAVLRFRYPDPAHRLAGVRLSSSAIRADLAFRADLGGWEVCCARPPLWRLDYHLELTGPGGERRTTEQAELRCPGYAEPDWLTAPAVTGTWRRMRLPGLTARVWSPPDDTDRVLVAHDGPEYDRCGRLGDYTAAAIGSGSVRPYHLVLLPPAGPTASGPLARRTANGPLARRTANGPLAGKAAKGALAGKTAVGALAGRRSGGRERIYAADPGYAGFLAGELIPRIRARLGGGPVAGAGVSLGALAMLHAQWRFPDAFAGLFLQSGSYFRPCHDRQEAGFRFFRRIVRFTGRLRHSGFGPGIPVTLTCGAAEENLANNRDVAESLRKQGYAVEFAENPDAHTWTGWRDALHPHLTGLLRRVWT
jgi:enterochelin esterase family protein